MEQSLLSQSTQHSYSISLQKIGADINYTTISLLDYAHIASGNFPSDYRAIVRSNDETTLYDTNFLFPSQAIGVPPRNWFDTNGNQVIFPNTSSDVYYADVNMLLDLPYFESAKDIQIIDLNGQLKLSIDVTQFAPKISYSISNGAGILNSGNYNVIYSISQTPTGVLQSQNYVCRIQTIVD